MALEQVVPVVPQGTFSVTTRKLSWVLPFPPQYRGKQKRAQGPGAYLGDVPSLHLGPLRDG